MTGFLGNGPEGDINPYGGKEEGQDFTAVESFDELCGCSAVEGVTSESVSEQGVNPAIAPFVEGTQQRARADEIAIQMGIDLEDYHAG